MLNLLYQQSIGVAQEIHEVQSEREPHGPLEQANITQGLFLKVGF